MATSVAAPPAASGTLSERLRARVGRDGPMRFDRYMEEALYARDGYYERTDAVLGRTGDFATAPGLGDLFARCLAQFCSHVLEACGGEVAEYGPGDGALARQLCAQLDGTPCTLIERSAALRARARRTLADCPQVHWRAALPAAFSGVVVANELLDAQGARCFEVVGERIVERRVGVRGDRLAWERADDAELAEAVARAHRDAQRAPCAGYRSEIRPDAHRDWLGALARALRRGVVLIVDYGYERRAYYHPQRRQGTLRAHARHRLAADPFQTPGRCDISVDVDFSAVADAARALDFEVLQFTTQAGFLLEHGLLEHAMRARTDRAALAVRAQVEMLTHPQRMGERFRVLALGRDMDLELPQTICSDHRHRL